MSLPSVPAGFYWTHESWGAALRCTALDAVADHLFTTRQLELSSPDGWRALAGALRARTVVSARQVHGNATMIVRPGERPEVPAEADVLVSADSGVGVCVRAADCAPILMADCGQGIVAAVHAGWRGTAARAAVAALEVMEGEFGTRREEVVAAIGPSIGVCCYEVGPELVDAFAAAGHPRHLIDRWFSTPRPLHEPGEERARIRSRRERPALRLDVAGANRDQLVLAGVPEERIHIAGLCTAMHLDVLTSYRAERERAGRIAGVIRAR
jgi:YfiH family protein